jgi:serine/threonine protein phosphatase 1
MLTYAIGDVHGCLDKLQRILVRCRDHGGDRPRRLVFVGDYVDRGPDSRGVIETLLALQQQEAEMVCLRGNHEAMMLEAFATGDEDLWLLNGGGSTLGSYGIRQALDLPGEHMDWVTRLPLSFDDGWRLFVHAGLNPHAPLDRQTEEDVLWIREPFLSSRRDFGRLVVHGHTPLRTGVPDLRANRLNLDTAAVFGGPLTAAVFEDGQREPVAFLTDV